MINDFLLRKLSDQYDGRITGEKLNKIYRYELSDWEHMAIWAYKTDIVLEKIKNLSKRCIAKLRQTINSNGFRYGNMKQSSLNMPLLG